VLTKGVGYLFYSRAKFPAPSINFTLLFPSLFVFGESQHFSKSIFSDNGIWIENTNVLPLACSTPILLPLKTNVLILNELDIRKNATASSHNYHPKNIVYRNNFAAIGRFQGATNV
jgi:hypothetical protein